METLIHFTTTAIGPVVCGEDAPEGPVGLTTSTAAEIVTCPACRDWTRRICQHCGGDNH